MFPAPKSGDVLFTGGSGFETFASVAIQRLVDVATQNATKAFGHVAIALDDAIAFESVPTEDGADGTVLARWSGVELKFGARLIPIRDILVGAVSGGTALSVLRRGLQTNGVLDPMSSGVLWRIGGAHSIDSLKDSAEQQTRHLLPVFLRDMFDWSAPAADFMTEIGMTDETRRTMEALIPGYLPQYHSRSYFCSQLVRDLLHEAGVLASDATEPVVTPTGLFARLTALGWMDVTDSDYSDTAIRALIHDDLIRASTAASFVELETLIALKKPMVVLGAEAAAIEASQLKMRQITSEITDRLDRLTNNKRKPSEPE